MCFGLFRGLYFSTETRNLLNARLRNPLSRIQRSEGEETGGGAGSQGNFARAEIFF